MTAVTARDGVVTRVRGWLPVRCAARFVAIGGRDRVLVLAGQAFTTLVPLFIIVAAATSGPGSTALGDRLIARFRVSGDAADAIRTLFARPPDAAGSLTVAGVVVLVASLLSLTRSLQRTYEAAWQLPPSGVRGRLSGLGGMGLLLTQLIVLSLLTGALRQVPAGSVLAAALRAVAATGLWLVLQHLLLAGRVPRHRLLPGAIVAGIGQVVVSLVSALWMPRLIAGNAERYGLIGVTFALLSWLIVMAAAVVATAVVSAEVGSAGGPPHPPRARRPARHGTEHDGVAIHLPAGRTSMATLTVWRFATSDGADQATSTLTNLARQQLITIHDAATVSWEPGAKKPKTRQLNDLTGGGALGGMFWGLLFGLIFFVPLLGAAIGAATGALSGALTDVGIDDGFIKQVRDQVQPGTSALFLLASDAVLDKVKDAFTGQQPELLRTNLSTEQEAKLREVFVD